MVLGGWAAVSYERGSPVVGMRDGRLDALPESGRKGSRQEPRQPVQGYLALKKTLSHLGPP